ncbi:MAG: hypothetical protein LUD68_04355 [Rikenellaceae bacterium]|nr:hypothetical protein [Rikenellaceae bacterium]
MITGKFGYYFSKGNAYSSRQDDAHYSKALESAIALHEEGYSRQDSYTVLPLWNSANQAIFDSGSTWIYMTNLHQATTAAYAKGNPPAPE